jgi:hypothetical protein
MIDVEVYMEDAEFFYEEDLLSVSGYERPLRGLADDLRALCERWGDTAVVVQEPDRAGGYNIWMRGKVRKKPA